MLKAREQGSCERKLDMICQVTQQPKGQGYFGLNMKRLQASQDKKNKHKLEKAWREADTLFGEWLLALWRKMKRGETGGAAREPGAHCTAAALCGDKWLSAVFISYLTRNWSSLVKCIHSPHTRLLIHMPVALTVQVRQS